VDRQASAMAFPWAVSVGAEAESQTVGSSVRCEVDCS
jgi:hypothetical protein